MTATNLTYQNCKGDTYFVHSKLTKTGATTYYVAKRRDEAKAVDTMPAGFEFHESPTGSVSIRRLLVSQITDLEYDAVVLAVSSLVKAAPDTLKLDRCKSYVTLWTADEPKDMFRHLGLDEGFAQAFPHRAAALRKLSLQFMVCMRFGPLEKKSSGVGRTFLAERFCYRGSVDDWIDLSRGPLNELLVKHLLHVGKESLFLRHLG